MEIEKLDYEPGYKLNITATITDQAIKFENRCMGEALSLWQIKKEDVLARIQEADKLKAENEKLRAELEQVKQKYEEVREAICTHCMDFPCREESCFWWRGQEEG